jgi:hypothetical protein
MIKKSLVALVLVSLFGIVGIEASVSKKQLMHIVKKQEILSEKLMSDYKSQSLMQTIGTIEEAHAVLQKNIRDPKVKNLIHYLDTCVSDLKKLSKKPYTKENALIVSEISLLLSEGSHYMQSRLK